MSDDLSEQLPKVWIISWAYSDKSGGGIIRAFDNEDTAMDLLHLLNKFGGERSYFIEGVDICKEYD